MKVSYYPGCDLYTKAKPLNTSIQASFKELGVELVELNHWYCCGTTFTLAKDNRISLISPLRILAMAQKVDGLVLVPCSICYNTLKRANFLLKKDPETLKILNEHIGESYDGSGRIVHPFEFFRENRDLIEKKIKKDLKGIKLGCYYGCYLLRPKAEVQFDDPEAPTIIEEFVRLLGATPISFPFGVECCGSYLIINSPEAAADASYKILKNATSEGAEALVTSCPLCHYNLDTLQRRISEQHLEFKPLPVFYFSQILAIGLNIPPEFWGLEQNRVSPASFLKEYKLL